MKILALIFVLVLSLVNLSHAEQTFDLEKIILEASRSNDTVGNMNKDVSVITSQDIANAPGKSLPELLGTKAGVYGIQYGNIKNSQVDLGSFGETSLSNTLVLVDGRRTNQIDLSGQDWAQIDLNSVDRIEIIKGSGSVLYGDNADGGVINIVTKKGHKDQRPSITLFNEIGNYQTQKHSFDLSGGTHVLDYRMDYAREQTTGYRAQSDYWADDFNTRLGFDPTDAFGIDFSQGYHLDSYQLPGALFLSNIEQFGRTGVRPSLNNDHGWTSDSHFDVTPHLKFNFGTSDGEFSLFTSERKRDNKFFTGSTVYETMYETNSYEFQPKAVLSTPLSESLGNKLTLGYDVFYAKNKRRSGYLGPAEDLVFVSKATEGAYILDELTINEKWLLNTGFRQTWASYVFDQKEQIAGKSWIKSRTPGYEDGLGYKYNARSKVYVNYAHSYRLPAVDEFYQNLYDFGFGPQGGLNPDLTFQTGNEYHWGVKDNTLKNIRFSMDFYVAQYKNEIYLDPQTFFNTNYNGRTRHYGQEADLAVDLFNGKVEPFVNVTFEQASFVKGQYSGNEIPFVPNQMANAGVIWRPLKGLSTKLSVNEVGKSFAISDQTNTHPKLKSYTTADWNARYVFKNIEVWVGLNNIFNKKYYTYGVYSTFANDTGYYPAPGRNVSGGVKLKF